MSPLKTCGAFPRFLRRAIRLHDSQVLSVAAAGEDVRVRLDAYLVVSTGQAGTAWSQAVDLVVAGEVVVALGGEEGRLSIRGRGLAVVEQGEKVFVEKVPAASLRD